MTRTLLAVAILAGLCRAEDVQVALASQDVINARLARGLAGARQRQSTIQELFTQAGCATEIQQVDRKSGNVICTLPGAAESTIVVGGHFDFADEGKGIIDDWSGASLLPSLYEALKSQPRRHTYIFVAFAAEETGLNGSKRYVKALTADQKSHIHGFVNLECLGVGPVNVWLSRADKALAARAVEVSRAVGVPLQAVNADNVGFDDSFPFTDAHLPVITFHSLTQEMLHFIHSSKDRLDAIHSEDYYAAYKLTGYYLAWLDAKID